MFKTRSDVTQTISIDEVLEKDLIKNNWDSFVIKRPTTFYEVSENDIQRPDLISLNVYGNVDYWWILMKYNQIDDIWNDLYPTLVLTCPDQFDISQWLSSIKI